jgi:tetratricopeptide (TPR) repeat protein
MTKENEISQNQKETFIAENEKAEEYISKNDLPSAAKILVDIVSKDPSNWRAYNNLGILCWVQKAWEDAWMMFKKSATLKPDYCDALINLFDGALKLRRIKEALPYFERALEINPDLEEIKIIRDSIINQGEDIYKSERALVVGVYHSGVEEAQKLISEGKFFSAMEKLLKINDEEGPSAEVYAGLGIISFHQKRYEDAYRLFLESIKLNPTSRDNFLNLLDSAKACGKVEEAKQIFKSYAENFSFLNTIAEEFEKA